MTSPRVGPSPLALMALHGRLHVLQTVRIPFVLVSLTVFPTMAFLFFVLPRGGVDDPVAATTGTAQLALFAVMSVCLFTFGAGVAEDRALPWDAALRILPAGPGPRLAGRLLSGLPLLLLGLVPLLVVSGLLTSATLPVERWLPTIATLLLAGLPLLALGQTIGYALSAKASVAAAQLLLLPLAFVGGVFIPPETFPGWLDALSRVLPTRAGRDVVVATATGGAPPIGALVVLVAWLLVLGAAAIWAYRRDEGARYR